MHPLLNSRRNFIKKASLAASVYPVYSNFSHLMHSGNNTETEFSFHVFSKHLQFLDVAEMAETVKEIGFDGPDLAVRPGGHVNPEKVTVELPQAVKSIKAVGLNVKMMTTKITNPDDLNTEIILKTASDLGIQYYRMGYLKYKKEISIEDNLLKLKPDIWTLAALNKKYGIHGAYQNHSGTYVGSPLWDLYELIKGTDPKWLGCQYDIRHAVVEGGRSWPLGLNLLKAHIKSIVIKDFKWGEENGEWKIINTPIGEGMVDFKKYFKLLKKYEIKVPVSVHFEYKMPEEDDSLNKEEKKKKTIEVMKKDLTKLKEMMKSAELI
ncbi:sugar phosphate isomerase/epimerase family protein [Flexithrix dorotheae]|uniref:sugar phosphate isomerase/epimerase family protein n=1 Tax=Flexithrix dorotheae TaxID=70993 RepID=UPI00037D28D1|nr:TIM barrel protein [Flexithrix dorotheae]